MMRLPEVQLKNFIIKSQSGGTSFLVNGFKARNGTTERHPLKKHAVGTPALSRVLFGLSKTSNRRVGSPPFGHLKRAGGDTRKEISQNK